MRDPTTGNEIIIEDVTADFRKTAENPRVVVPKTAIPGQLGGVAVSIFFLYWGYYAGTEVLIHWQENDFASPTQPLDEYKEKQDVTAPPAPVKPGTTVDVPIRGEKTNVSCLVWRRWTMGADSGIRCCSTPRRH